MEERIKKLMDYLGISPSEFADSIGVQRSNVTHVLKGRNMPSHQFMQKLLQIYPTVNARWLLVGEGNMIEGVPNKAANLFDSMLEPKILNKPAEKIEQEPVKESQTVNKETVPPTVAKEKKEPDNELSGALFGSEKPIERLIVFYKDQTFTVYNPSR